MHRRDNSLQVLWKSLDTEEKNRDQMQNDPSDQSLFTNKQKRSESSLCPWFFPSPPVTRYGSDRQKGDFPIWRRDEKCERDETIKKGRRIKT